MKHKEYLEEVSKIDVNKMKFLDETGSNLAMSRTHARSPRGERAVGKVPENRGEQTTIVGVLGIDGILCEAKFQGAMNEYKMIDFIDNVLAKVWKEEDILFMDNLSSHKTPSVLMALGKHKIKYIYVPPYHPELNPIEHFWNMLKSLLKSIAPRQTIELWIAIGNIFEMIGDTDATKIFKKCGYPADKKDETKSMAA